jgi:transposase
LDHHKKQNRNSPKISLHDLSWQWNSAVDMMSIKGVSHSTVHSVISEAGQSIHKFPTAKKFAARLRFTPDTRITGGKVISSHVRKGSNRLAAAIRHAADSIGKQTDAPLYPFFQRILHRDGRCAAIIATARKLAVIIWNMLTKKEPYKPYDTAKIESQMREKQIKKINKLMQVFDVKASEVKFATG